MFAPIRTDNLIHVNRQEKLNRPMRYIERLIENCQKAKSTNPKREFVMKNSSDLDGIKQAIYIIEQIGGDHEKTFLDFSKFKQTKQRACAKLNAPSQILYVGSSTTNLSKRISEHLGNGNKATYALHLSHWFKGMGFVAQSAEGTEFP